ncbi:hypothetical protein [Aphanothece sacrum]|uniref:Uncharacterized protein n=1 Tax=Aphanothece sacrum FPU1 TaxID=1920663 RepID=A0A401IFN9_APHSA|nr:hypothetical protein [Aphanothece sacrum]GBF80034.1 hypothetical protein AsFPU1_1435 [Aphanothece sacrum FPU1]GBF84577.1 hypothetical protein AsFPU3_1629 [Aphanothece sacrum FPU3]
MIKLIPVIVLLVYVGGIWLFIKGYNYTNFSRQLLPKLALALLWPALLIINPSYRKNFQKALKGRD